MKLLFGIMMLSPLLTLQALKIDRVIVATDANPTYLHFWPIVAQAWQEKLGIKPTLALIADETVQVDESLGDVIRFKPLQGVPTGQQAQTIRILLPALFPDEISLTSDIDMLPLSKDYFNNAIAHVPDNCFVTYMNRAYREGYPAFPICYNAAKGSTFKEIFKINSLDDIAKTMQQWNTLGLGWQTDERMLYKYLTQWQDAPSRFVKLNDATGPRRVDRANWQYDKKMLQENFYIDAHCLRPYHMHKEKIDQLLADCSPA